MIGFPQYAAEGSGRQANCLGTGTIALRSQSGKGELIALNATVYAGAERVSDRFSLNRFENKPVPCPENLVRIGFTRLIIKAPFETVGRQATFVDNLPESSQFGFDLQFSNSPPARPTCTVMPNMHTGRLIQSHRP